jgi:uncharacterized protein (TIGR00251 family)
MRRGRDLEREPVHGVPPDRTIFHLHVQPRAKRTEVVGWHGDAIKVRVAAPPVDGAANTLLVDFFAEALGVARADVRLEAGTTSRRKRIAVLGITRHAALRRLGLA